MYIVRRFEFDLMILLCVFLCEGGCPVLSLCFIILPEGWLCVFIASVL